MLCYLQNNKVNLVLNKDYLPVILEIKLHKEAKHCRLTKFELSFNNFKNCGIESVNCKSYGACKDSSPIYIIDIFSY